MEISDNNFNTSIFFDTNELGFKQITPAYLIKIQPSFYDNQYNLKVNSDGVIVNDLYVSSITNASNNGSINQQNRKNKTHFLLKKFFKIEKITNGKRERMRKKIQGDSSNNK